MPGVDSVVNDDDDDNDDNDVILCYGLSRHITLFCSLLTQNEHVYVNHNTTLRRILLCYDSFTSACLNDQ